MIIFFCLNYVYLHWFIIFYILAPRLVGFWLAVLEIRIQNGHSACFLFLLLNRERIFFINLSVK